MNEIVSLVGRYWLLLVAGCGLGLVALYRRGDRDRILKHPDLAGLAIISISPLKQGARELDLAYAQTRSGGSYFKVLIDQKGYPMRQIWMVEAGSARRIQ